MFKVGLTGGIGSGKSTVTHFFQNLSIDVIDLDKLARDVVAPNSEALNQIAKHFGKTVIDTNGHLIRKELGSLIFNNAKDKFWLEKLLHPLIQEKKQQIIDASTSQYVVIEIPLLTENGLENSVDRVLLVDCDESIQNRRAVDRGAQSAEQVQRIIEQQSSREKRQVIADDIVLNEGSIKDLEEKLHDLHLSYLTLSSIK